MTTDQVATPPTPDTPGGDLRGFITPTPTAEQARRVNEAIRSGDYTPTLIGVFCDECEITVEADYLVGVEDDQRARFEVARAHLRTQGWRCDPRADLCPDCGTPTLDAIRTGASLIVDCPFCPDEHRHGVPPNAPFGAGNGSRLSHCHGAYRDRKGVYTIREVARG